MTRRYKLNKKNNEKVFHELSCKEQNDIRRKYKEECNREYRYSINLYILYVILGIICVIGLFVCFLNILWGMVIFTLGIILMIIDIYFLKRSNDSFYKYLKSIGYVYDKK